MAMLLDDLPDDAGKASTQGADMSADPADPFVAGLLQAFVPDACAELTAAPQQSFKPGPARVLLRPPRLA